MALSELSMGSFTCLNKIQEQDTNCMSDRRNFTRCPRAFCFTYGILIIEAVFL